jgi:GrpB-like predicted nucleotidyltransferase (UPF0157 family)
MDEIEIVAYDPSWPALFAAESAQLRRVLAVLPVLAVEHVGSTAVAGLAAKPIIDIHVTVAALSAAAASIAPLEAMGYSFWRDNPDKTSMFFVKGLPPAAALRTHHVHITEPEKLVERLLFRDYLRAHSDEAARYEALKRRLANDHRHDREAYTQAKTAFVRLCLERARAGV